MSPPLDAVPGLPEQAWRRLLRPTISKKFLAFAGIVAFLTAANGLVVKSMLEQRANVAATVDVAGSLRWLSLATQVELQRQVLGLDNGPAVLDATLDRFERQLRALELGGRVDGIEVQPLPAELRPMLGPVRRGWRDYRAGVNAVLEQWRAKQDVRAALDRLHEDANATLVAGDDIVVRLTQHALAAEDGSIALLAVLALLDVGAMIIGLRLIRLQVVSPLRTLAQASRRFAQGHFGERVGFRSADEIGQLAAAFDYMADETQRHIQRIANDVVEIRRAEQNLRKLSRAVEHSPASVVITDSYGTIEYVNPKFVETTGYSAQECLGQKPRMLKSGTTPAAVYKDLWATVLAGREWRGELQNRRKSGQLFWQALRISPIRNEEGRITHFATVMEDITERKNAEEESRRINLELERRVEERTRQLEASNRELEAFSYSVSHDLRAPLRGINGFAQLVAERCAACPQQEALGYLERIRKASVRMGELIDDLLRLSHIGRLELAPESVDLSEIARQVLADLAVAAPERGVEADVMDGVVVQGDPRLLRVVLENLLGNAWKFTARRDVARIAFGRHEQDGEPVVFVRDNGAGFDPRYAGKLFSAFQRLHSTEEFDGSGIGLAIVQRIVSLHGGRIRAEAEPDNGAVFSFVLPEHQPVKA